MSSGPREYFELLDELLWRRARRGVLSDDEEESFANALHKCRALMRDDERERIGKIFSKRRVYAAQEALGLVDTLEPPLRKPG